MSVPPELTFRTPIRPVLLETVAVALVTTGLGLAGAQLALRLGLVFCAISVGRLIGHAWGRTVITQAELRSRSGLRWHTVAWNNVWMIETINAPRSRFVEVQSGSRQSFRLGGVIGSRWRPDERFDGQLAMVTERATLGGLRNGSRVVGWLPRWALPALLAVVIGATLTAEGIWYWRPFS